MRISGPGRRIGRFLVKKGGVACRTPVLWQYHLACWVNSFCTALPHSNRSSSFWNVQNTYTYQRMVTFQCQICTVIPVVNQHHSSQRVKVCTGLSAQVPTCTFVDAFLHCFKQFMHNLCSSSQNFYYRYNVETKSQFSRKQFRCEFYTSFISVAYFASSLTRILYCVV